MLREAPHNEEELGKGDRSPPLCPLSCLLPPTCAHRPQKNAWKKELATASRSSTTGAPAKLQALEEKARQELQRELRDAGSAGTAVGYASAVHPSGLGQRGGGW